MSGRTGMTNPTAKQVHKLSKLLLENGASHDDVWRVRNMLKTWTSGRFTVSGWIDQLDNTDPVVSGECAMDVCRKADKHHYSTLNRAKKRDAA